MPAGYLIYVLKPNLISACMCSQSPYVCVCVRVCARLCDLLIGIGLKWQEPESLLIARQSVGRL